MMIRRASSDSARAIATSWRWPASSRPTVSAGGTWVSPRAASACAAPGNSERGRPRKMFSATESDETSCSSCGITAIPASIASRGLSIRRGAPSMWTSPPYVEISPERTLIRVDLPAPFSPINACTSPGRTSKSTPSSARTPGNSIDTPRASTRAVMGVACAATRRPPSSRAQRGIPNSLRPVRRSSAGSLVAPRLGMTACRPWLILIPVVSAASSDPSPARSGRAAPTSPGRARRTRRPPPPAA